MTDTISGVTLDGIGGVPIQARVTVIRTNDNTVAASALSDNVTGAFEFTDLGTGTFELLTFIEGRKPYMDGPWALTSTELEFGLATESGIQITTEAGTPIIIEAAP